MALLALALAITAATSPAVLVLPVVGVGESAQLAAAQRLTVAAIERVTYVHAVLAPTSAGAFDELCREAACLAHHSTNQQQVVFVELVPFGGTTTVTLDAWDPRAPDLVRSATRTAAHVDDIPHTIELVVAQVWPQLPAHGVAEVARRSEAKSETLEWTPTVAFSLKVGNLFPGFNGTGLSLSGINPRLDFEVDYYALPNFLTFINASLVFASQSGGESASLVPVLLGAKYLFREGKSLRPYLGVGVGLGFLTSSLNQASSTTTSFSVYGVIGLAYFPWRQVGFVIESTANLTGLEVSASNGVLFAVSGDLGVVFVF